MPAFSMRILPGVVGIIVRPRRPQNAGPVAFKPIDGEQGMKVVRFSEAERYEPEDNWQRSSLCNENDVSIEHFVKPAGHASPHHAHANAQVLVVLDGKLIISVEDDEQELGPGDAAYIAGNEAHVVRNPLDKPSCGLDIFVPGRSFDFWLKRKQTGA